MAIDDDLLSPQIPPDRIKVRVTVDVIQGQTELSGNKVYMVDQGVAFTGGLTRMESFNERAQTILYGLIRILKGGERG